MKSPSEIATLCLEIQIFLCYRVHPAQVQQRIRICLRHRFPHVYILLALPLLKTQV